MNIKKIIYQYFPKSTNISLEQYKEGAVNLTYHLTVEENGGKKDYLLQKMNTIFDVSVMKDIEYITNHLSSKKIKTQKIVKTQKGDMFVKDGTSWWRMFTYIPGKVFYDTFSSNQARESGKLVGAFHNALIDCNYKFKFKLPHYHDTDFIMKKLRFTLIKNKNTNKYKQLKNFAENILSSYKELPKNIKLPRRIIHGDLKRSNVLFDNNKAIALIDIDTLMHGTIVVELGDALRDWCMRGGEDAGKAHFDKSIYASALDGYFSTAKFLTPSEKKSIPYGVRLIALELAARFTIDAFDESYFNLNSSKYKNLFEQNKKRAENQFDFFKEFLASGII